MLALLLRYRTCVCQARLGPILNEIMSSLNERAECVIPLDDGNTLSLRLFVPRAEPPHIADYEVPRFVWCVIATLLL